MTTVGDLRRIANRILDQLDGLGDDERVAVYSNTYGMGMSILGTKDGYIDYSEPIEIDEDDEEVDE